MSETWFWWSAIALAAVAAAMATFGLGHVGGARRLVAIGLLGLAGASGFERASWVAVIGAVVAVGGARALIGAWATFALACVVAVAGSVASIEHPDARGVLVGAALAAAGWAADRFALPVLAVPGLHGAACVVVLGVLPFRDAPLMSVIATSVFAAAVGWFWWGMRAQIDRALFGRPGVRASILVSLIAAVVMIAIEQEATGVMMFATITTLLPFFSND